MSILKDLLPKDFINKVNAILFLVSDIDDKLILKFTANGEWSIKTATLTNNDQRSTLQDIHEAAMKITLGCPRISNIHSDMI